jgi:glycosyltransferase involved in cell wall biosynthesis
MADAVHRVLLLDGELSFRGSSLQTLRLARGLERRDIDTALVCTRMGALDHSLLSGVRLHRVSGYQLPVWGRVVMQTLLRDVRREPPDLICLQDSGLISQASWLAGRLRRPLVVSVGEHAEAASLPQRQPSPWLKAFVSVSESVQSQIPATPGLAGIEKRVIHPGVTAEQQNSERLPPDPNRQRVVGMAGPLEVIKGASFFLRACHRVVEAGHDIRIVIAGSGPEERSLRQLASSLELTRRLTIVDGGVSMKAYLSAMDIFCLPSLQQGLGVMMLEAMSLGIPVIASGVGGVLNVIDDGVTGLIVPPSDSRSLADRIISLLQEPSRILQLGLAGRQRTCEQFSEQRMLDETVRLFQEVCGSSVNPLVAGSVR